jgi:hypothetical protein
MNSYNGDSRSSHSSAALQAAGLDESLDEALDAMGDDGPDDETEDDGPGGARKLLDDVRRMGSRMRQNRMRSQQTDRRAAAYASRLARHTARLLDHMPDAVPAVRPVPGTGASALRHYILRHDKLTAPDRVRLLVVSSDGRLRLCTVLNDRAGSRLWTDFEVANPPSTLPLNIVFEGLSALILRLEGAVTLAESKTMEKEIEVADLIAESEALLFNSGSKLTPIDNREKPVGLEETAEERDRRLRSHGFERMPLERDPTPE